MNQKPRGIFFFKEMEFFLKCVSFLQFHVKLSPGVTFVKMILSKMHATWNLSKSMCCILKLQKIIGKLQLFLILFQRKRYSPFTLTWLMTNYFQVEFFSFNHRKQWKLSVCKKVINQVRVNALYIQTVRELGEQVFRRNQMAQGFVLFSSIFHSSEKKR